MLSRAMRSCVAACQVLAALGYSGAAAAADTMVGIDADGAIPTTGGNLLGGGGGFGIRLGAQLHLPALRVAGEIGYGYEHLFANQAPSDWTTHRAFAGARLGVGELLVPFAFAHLGYGWRSTPDSSYGGSGAAFDGGLGLDLNLGFIAVGAHLGYAYIDAQPMPPQWIIAGLDGAIVF